jgi:exopolyphosphatase/guanosine-5'-triphosphate,3'-diphosphate pyrophosphatase
MPAVNDLKARTGGAARRRTIAAADAGANSVHLLVARLADRDLEVLADESEFLGLGVAADRGWLGSELRSRLLETLGRQIATARSLGAEVVVLVGTEPLRRSADAARVVVEVERAGGAPLFVLSHAEEGLLTLLGVTRGAPVADDLVVVDIGGGSSEIVEAKPGRAPSAVGLAVGSARLTAAVVRHDPPTRREWATLRVRARELVGAAPPGRPKRLVVVGGTATNLGRIVPDGIAAEDAGRALTAALVEAAASALLAEPSVVVAERFALRPERARVLLAGAAILLALLEHYGMATAEISGASLREGLVFSVARAGRAWRDRLGELVQRW